MKQLCNKGLNILKILPHTTLGVDRTSLIVLDMVLVTSKWDTCCETYSFACATYMDVLQPIPNHAIRIAVGAFKSPTIASFQSETGLNSLDKYRDIKILNCNIRIKANTDRVLVNRVIPRTDQPRTQNIKKCSWQCVIYHIKE